MNKTQRSFFHGGIYSHLKLLIVDFKKLPNILDIYTHKKYPLTAEVIFQFKFEWDLKTH